jgi:dolichyl-phosphate-mannose--protein O-mannosyl transferase
MVTAIHIIKFTIKLLLLIISFPFFLAWIACKYLKFRYTLTSNLVKSGMPKRYAKELAGLVTIQKMLKI